MTELILPADCLAVFLDETGHEDLATGHSVYGIGDCAVLAPNLENYLRAPWREVRRTLNGSADTPLHAAGLSGKISRDKQVAVGTFFRENMFARIGIALTTRTSAPNLASRLEFMAPCLINRVLDVLKWSNAASVALIFEANERAAKHLQQHFGQITIGENGVDIPMQGYFMPKSANDPALEVADFVMHAVHGLARDRATVLDGYGRLDFQATFQSVGEKLSSFMLIAKVEQNSPMSITAP